MLCCHSHHNEEHPQQLRHLRHNEENPSELQRLAEVMQLILDHSLLGLIEVHQLFDLQSTAPKEEEPVYQEDCVNPQPLTVFRLLHLHPHLLRLLLPHLGLIEEDAAEEVHQLQSA